MRMRNPLKKSKRRQFLELQEDRGFTPGQFATPEPKVPWKAIGLAALLFTMGSVLVVVGALIKVGYITSEIWLSRGIPFLVLGSVMFIPGAYHLYLAYYAYYKYPGYDFTMIPDWD
ncbi:hypothetical protein O0I10_002642 [Lichtheimia ornata]|uniref:Transmembrane protein 230 n=1 Tax=Lichtheimia ornata TaxID=688661 RepID=A0AAD7VBY2_9FUNG|nr:uncharacterized protein O0I10_002642 [Lichtheimia ornata]KAJ8661376.1 hypothetical protein O0I10_002642 [Lichtheimia ornata]